MSRTIRAGVLAATAAAAVATAGTSFDSTWKAPDAQALNFKGRKVAALVIVKDESVRYGSEDALAQQITARGAVGIPVYTLVPKELTADKEKAKALLEQAGIAGIVSMRVVGTDRDMSSTGGTYWGGSYSTFWAGGGYYGWAWGGAYDPGYVRMDTIVAVESLVYSMDQDKLVWAGRSQTKNPKKVREFVKELTGKIASELKKERLIR